MVMAIPTTMVIINSATIMKKLFKFVALAAIAAKLLKIKKFRLRLPLSPRHSPVLRPEPISATTQFSGEPESI